MASGHILQTPSARFPRVVARAVSAARANVVLAEGLEPSWAVLNPADFHAVYGFPGRGALGELMPGLRSGLSLHPPQSFRSLGAAR